MTAATYFHGIFDALSQMALSVKDAVIDELTSPDSPISLYALIIVPTLVFLAFKLGRTFDYNNTVEARFENDRSLKAIWHWLFQKRVIFTKSTLQDLKITVFNFLLSGPLFFFGIPYGGTETMGAVRAPLIRWLNLSPQQITPMPNNFMMDLAYVVAVLIGYNFGAWAAHYLMHRLPFLWEYHKVHHSAKVLTGLSNSRFHIFDDLFWSASAGVGMTVVGLLFPLIFGFTPSGNQNRLAFALVSLFTIPVSVLLHSPIWISFGKLEFIFPSPAMHAIHHSADPKHFNKNFGPSLSIFDLLFGTLVRAEKKPVEKLKLGVDDDYDWENAGAWRLFASPIKRSLTVLISGKPSNEGSTDKSSKDAA